MSKRILAPVVIAVVLSATACAGSQQGDDAGKKPVGAGAKAGNDGAAPGDYGVEVDTKAAALVPEKYRNGVVVVGDPQYPPADMLDEKGKEVGYAVDLAEAIGTVLGIKVENKRTGFDGIIPGMQAERYDFSLFNDTEERRATLDFVDLTSSGSSLLTLKGNPSKLDINDLCGATVGAAKGSAQATVVPEQLSRECKEAGKEAVHVETFPGANDAVLAVKSDRVQGAIVDTFLAGYVNKQGQGLEKTGDAVGKGLWGIGLTKGSPLVKPFAAGLQSLIDSGAYSKILEKWGVQDVALPAALVNGEPVK